MNKMKNIKEVIWYYLTWQSYINKQKLNIIASIPYIGEKYAERLLKSFKTIRNVINASPQELYLKAKIPYKTSIKIWRILNEEYKRWNIKSIS